MLARIRKARAEERGFTLIELLVVIIIIGILAAIAIPLFLSQRRKGWDAQAKSDLKNMATAEETWISENNAYTADVADLVTAGFKKSADVSLHSAKIDLAATAAGYCLSATSKSTTVFYFSSYQGALTTTVPSGC